ncbi:MAG: (2Fe-2S) ferredoxin domain-containing protein [Sinobacteraceae bacterium]|nr:(2Fe-2S) ferredoxin domain-containing protein [Nevskia sp.]MDI3260678.1 (2Fe-2S) ferredoxin domain-containing protein [Nevskiaceae bacterium]
MSYYRTHVFFCCNQRPPGAPRGCCNDKGGSRLRDYCKQRVRALGLDGPGKIRINQSGCLDRCELGPTVVVYPEGVWYRCVDERDVDELIESHLCRGQIVARLLI